MKDKNTAGILALLIGSLGIHRFYLNQAGLGILYIILTVVSCGLFAIVPLIDAIIFFTMDDRTFNLRYNPGVADNFNPPPVRPSHVHVHVHQESPNPAPKTRPEVRKTLRENTRRPNPFKASGVRKFRDYDFKGAKEDFKKALAVSYNDVAVHFNLACCYSVLEDIDKSLFHLSKSVEFGLADLDKIHQHDSLAFLRAHDEFEAFAKNGYKWEAKPPTPPAEPPQLDAPKDDLLDNPETDLLDQLNRQPPKEKVAITNDPKTKEMDYNRADELFDDIFGDDDDTPPNPDGYRDHTPPQNSYDSNNLVEQLRRLGELRDQGILTQEEFEVQKKKLLG